MELIENKEIINKICNEKNKNREETSLRRLWWECFGDPLAYEDFYFTNVYRHNTVYMIREKGMLHLNPYSCMVQGNNIMLHYIVGVATRESERRKGIMKRLLEKALSDMYQNREPFTYLMPADERYYQPFDFVSISKKRERVLQNKVDYKERSDTDSLGILEEKPVCFVKYTEISESFGEREQQRLFRWIDQLLSARYKIFARHDKSYFDLLLKEKQCQGGGVIFCFEGEKEIENFKGFFAYGTEKEKLFVEQYLFWDDRIESVLSRYAPGKTVIFCQFPFMARIVHVETFFMLFEKQFYEFAKEEKRLLITDPVLAGNNGIYIFSIKENGMVVKKQNVKEIQDEIMWDMKMTVKELADFIFCKQKEEAGHVFFAEVV